MFVHFKRVRASAKSINNKKASKSVHPFNWIFCSLTDTQTDKQENKQTNCTEDITPARFRGGVIMLYRDCDISDNSLVIEKLKFEKLKIALC